MSENGVSERWRGECKTCDVVIERDDEREVQQSMQGHARQLDHNVSVYRITDSDGPMAWLNCPACHRQYFAMKYDEGADELVFTCRECGSDYSFQNVKDKITDLSTTVTDRPNGGTDTHD